MSNPIIAVVVDPIVQPQARIITPLDINFVGYVSDDHLVLLVRSSAAFGLTGLEARFAMMDPSRSGAMQAHMLELGRQLCRAEPMGRA